MSDSSPAVGVAAQWGKGKGLRCWLWTGGCVNGGMAAPLSAPESGPSGIRKENRSVVRGSIREPFGAGEDASDKTILLVEGDPNDELLTLHALEEANIKNEVVVARDGEEALDYLFAEGMYAERDASTVPQMVLLEPKLAKVDGFQPLERLRADERTRRLPVTVFASSDEEQDWLESHVFGATIYIRKPLTVAELFEVVRGVGLYWLLPMELEKQPSIRKERYTEKGKGDSSP